LCSLLEYQHCKRKYKRRVTYELVVNDPLNEPGWIFFIMCVVKCSFNFCHHSRDVDVFLGFEGLDCMMELIYNSLARKPERMLC